MLLRLNELLCVFIAGWWLWGHAFVVYVVSRYTYVPWWWDCGVFPRTEWIREWHMVSHIVCGVLMIMLLPFQRLKMFRTVVSVAGVCLGLVTVASRVASTGPLTNVGYGLYGLAFLRELLGDADYKRLVVYTTWPVYYNVWYTFVPVKELVAWIWIVHVYCVNVNLSILTLAHITWVGYIIWLKYTRLQYFYFKNE